MSSFRHEVRHEPQQRPESCWWACTAMLMRFHGRPFHRAPWTFDPIFRELPVYAGQGVRCVERPTPAAWASEESRPLDPRLNGSWPRGFLHPGYWYHLGVPTEDAHFRLWASLTSLTPVTDLRNGNAWAQAGTDVSKQTLRRWIHAITESPLICVMDRDSRYHARLLVGYDADEERIADATVLVQDPARSETHAISSQPLGALAARYGQFVLRLAGPRAPRSRR